jgi:hypothetical protein
MITIGSDLTPPLPARSLQDPNHMITIGSEGFYAAQNAYNKVDLTGGSRHHRAASSAPPGSGSLSEALQQPVACGRHPPLTPCAPVSSPRPPAANNPATWAKDMGQDFIRNTNIKNVDYATVRWGNGGKARVLWGLGGPCVGALQRATASGCKGLGAGGVGEQ